MPDLAPANEKHYTVDDIAEIWAVSRDTVRRIFGHRDDVLKISRPATKYKRGHTTLRIPETVLHRVHRTLCTA